MKKSQGGRIARSLGKYCRSGEGNCQERKSSEQKKKTRKLGGGMKKCRHSKELLSKAKVELSEKVDRSTGRQGIQQREKWQRQKKELIVS